MDLRTIECFLAVVEEGSITRGATRLHMSQPPLTVRLKALEAELGVELLSRHGRGVEPTAAGRVLAERARRLLAEVHGATEAVRSVGHGVSGALSLAVGASVAPSLVADLLGELHAQAPEVAVTVRGGSDDAVRERVEYGDVDAGLVHLAPRATAGGSAARRGALETAVVTRELLLAVVRSVHPVAGTERADCVMLTVDTLIAPARGVAPALRDALLAVWTAAGGRPGQVVDSDATTTTLALVAAGLGVTLLPAAIARTAWPSLSAVPLRQHHDAVETAILWRADSPSPVLRRLLRIALATPEPDVLEPGHAREPLLSDQR